MLELFLGDAQCREIGATPGWQFKDRDEVIARYNEHKELKAALAAEQVRAERLAGELAAVMQAITDPENQPSQFGTVIAGGDADAQAALQAIAAYRESPRNSWAEDLREIKMIASAALALRPSGDGVGS